MASSPHACLQLIHWKLLHCRRLEEVTLRGARTPPQRPEGGGVPGADRLRQAVWANQQGGSSAVERRLDDGSGDDSGSGPRPDPRADHSSITYQWYGVRPDWEPHMTCVFVHGAGVTNDMAPRTSYKKYWGYMNEQYVDSSSSTHSSL